MPADKISINLDLIIINLSSLILSRISIYINLFSVVCSLLLFLILHCNFFQHLFTEGLVANDSAGVELDTDDGLSTALDSHVN